MDLSSIVKTLNNEEFTRRKNVNAGTSDKVTNKCFILQGGKFRFAEQTYIPSLFKVIDELLVNAEDHFVNCILGKTIQHGLKNDGGRYVKVINFSIEKNGEMIVVNDGYGIPIMKHSGRGDRYLPEVLFSDEKTGTNMEDDPNRITGGTNGIGATIVTAFSNTLTIECADKNYIYKQEVTKDKGLSVFATPEVSPNIAGRQYTKITFMIDWKKTKFNGFASHRELFNNYVLKRLYQIRLYTEHITEVAKEAGKLSPDRPIPKIMFNKEIDVNFSIKNEVAINEAFGLNRSYLMTIVRKKRSQITELQLCDVIRIVVGINELKETGYKEMSVINGVEVLNNPIISHVKSILIKAVKEYCAQQKMNMGKFKLKHSFTFLMVGCIPNPQWVGQVKEAFTIDKEYINQFDFKSACDAKKGEISKVIYEMIINSELRRKRTKDKDILEHESFCKCVNYAPKKDRKNSTNYFFFCEGGSAKTLIRSIGEKKMKINSDNTCILTTTGVVTNVFHKLNWFSNDNFEYFRLGFDEKPIRKLIFNSSIENNLFVKQFIAGSGVGEDHVDKERFLSSLMCDEFICAADSDYDGWNITGLILVLLSKWPALFEERRIKLLHLPVIRIVPNDLDVIYEKELRRLKGKPVSDEFIKSQNVVEFFTQTEFKEYMKAGNVIPSTHRVKYYKGLASTEKFFDEVISRDFDKYIFTFVWDRRASEMMEIYYGKTRVDYIDGEMVVINMADERKRLLAEPLREMTDPEIAAYKNRYITITAFLEIYVKQYFLDNLSRKLLKVPDGKNRVSTKIAYSLPTVLGKKPVKLSVIGPKISSETNYHHGETSLLESIQNSGQQYPGGSMFPLVIPVGRWGTRNDGGEHGNSGSAGAARYIEAKLNKDFYNLLYRKEDNIILPYQEEEEMAIEPKYMLPIFPMISVENYKTTAHGWKITMWARSFDDVYDYLRMLIYERYVPDDLPAKKVLNDKIKSHVLTMEKRNYDEGNEPKRVSTLSDGMTEEQFREIYISLGKYEIIKKRTLENKRKFDIVHIYSLPIGVWNKNYRDLILKRAKNTEKEKGDLIDIVRSIESLSDTNVDIVIELYDGWEDKIKSLIKREKLWFENYLSDIHILFRLYCKLEDEINVLRPDGTVISYNNHKELINDWFEFRLDQYKYRIARQKECTRLEIILAENKLRYVSNFDSYKLCRRSKKDFNETLQQQGFVPYRNIVMSNIKSNQIPNEKLVAIATTNMDEDDELLKELIKCGIVNKKLNYSYLSNVTTGQVTDEGISKLKAEIDRLNVKMAELNEPGIEKKIWLNELAKLHQLVRSE